MKTVRFEDLNEEIKNKIIAVQSDENQSEVDFEFILEGLVNKGKAIGFDIESENISYSGFYSQGDGLSFTCFVDTKKFIEEADHGLIIEEQLAFLEKYEEFEIVNIEIVRNYNNYVHEKSCSVESTDIKELFALYGAIERKRYQLSVETYTDMKDQYEEVGSKEYVIKQLKDLDFWYSLDGIQCFQEKPITYDFDFSEISQVAKKQNLTNADLHSLIDILTIVQLIRNTLDNLPDTEEYAPVFISGIDRLRYYQNKLDIFIPDYFIGEQSIKDSISYSFMDSVIEETYIESLYYNIKDAKNIKSILKEMVNYEYIAYSLSDDLYDVFSITFSINNIMEYMNCLDIITTINSKFETVDKPEPKLADLESLYSVDSLSDAELSIMRKWLEADDKIHDVYELDVYFEDNSYGAIEIVAEVLDRFKTCPDENEEKLFNKIQIIYDWARHDQD